MLKLRELRKEKSLTQEELASELGIARYIVANWEQERTQPNNDDLILLANYFEVSTDYLLGRSDDFGNIVLPMQKNSAETLSAEEKELVNCYRSCTISKRGAVMEYARFASERSADEIRNRG